MANGIDFRVYKLPLAKNLQKKPYFFSLHISTQRGYIAIHRHLGFYSNFPPSVSFSFKANSWCRISIGTVHTMFRSRIWFWSSICFHNLIKVNLKIFRRCLFLIGTLSTFVAIFLFKFCHWLQRQGQFMLQFIRFIVQIIKHNR